jgi:two-component system, NtrC family, response regulator AtoC
MAVPTIADLNRTAAPGSSSLYLVILGPEGAATHQLPTHGSVLLGRAEDAVVRLLDPLASRNHARLHLQGGGMEIEDLGSANGTRVREQEVPRGTRVRVNLGEAITIGSTILLVQSRAPTIKPRQVWPHVYFETRLIEECARAQSLRSTFALARLRLGDQSSVEQAREAIAAELRPGDVLATYGPREFELLLVDSQRSQSEAMVGRIVAGLRAMGMSARSSLVFYPTDGAAPQALVSRASALLLASDERRPVPEGFVVENPRMRQLYALAERVAAATINVLITGETGVGKEVLAATVHARSPRAGRPFLCINCAALSESILESELFGHEKGAFTGAVQTKPGLLEAASGGTLLLDEVGEMSLVMQAKLLRVLETREVMRVGATRPLSIDVRFIGATNRDLEEEVANKAFREDLFFRLNGICLEIPPLRERPEEIEPLARRCMENVARQLGRAAPALSTDALDLMRGYGWPGNIRELRNVMERAVILCSGDEITAEQLPAQKMRRPVEQEALPPTPAPPAMLAMPASAPRYAGPPGREGRAAAARQAITDALERCAGNQTRAAELLGISRRTLCSRLKEYNIPRPRV